MTRTENVSYSGVTTIENSVTVALPIVHLTFYQSQYSKMTSRTEMKWKTVLNPERSGAFIVHVDSRY